MKYLVNVKVTGSDNKARVLKWGITASSTNSPHAAVAKAADKLCAQVGHDRERCTFNRINSALGTEVWQIETHS